MSRTQKLTLVIAVGALISIPLWLLVAVPELEKLPRDYHSRVDFVGQVSWLDPGAEKISEPFPLQETMTHQVLARKGDVLIMQHNWTATDPATGEIFWEVKGRMGVDRATREHVPGFGDAEREGPFTFPLHVEKKDYGLWHPGLLTKGTWVFEREEVLQGLDTYVFTSSIKGLPSSELYPQHKPKRVHLDIWVTFWVEPISGHVVRHDEAWDGYFVKDGQKGQSVDVGNMSYTEETIADQVRIARRNKLLIQLYELWIPVGLAAVAVGLFVAVGVARFKESQRGREKKR
jgi:hypothetical protein